MTLSTAEPQTFGARSETKQAADRDSAAELCRGPEARLLSREAAAAVDTAFGTLAQTVRNAMLKHEGGCYCGSLRYAVAGDPLNTVICHCKSCQRQTGSAFSVVIAVPEGACRWTAALRPMRSLAIMGRLLDDISAQSVVRR
jgi:Glutathione-dependent formaldehyde-activating enzyme